LLWLSAIHCLSPSAGGQQKASITVSPAISLKDASDELGHAYEQRIPGGKVTFNYGSSATLQQFEQGAPVDIFFSAAENQMDVLATGGLLLTAKWRPCRGECMRVRRSSILVCWPLLKRKPCMPNRCAVFTYVETGNADAGIVYETEARTGTQARIIARAPAASHDPVAYPIAVERSVKNISEARAFLDFLESAYARGVFEKYGFTFAEKQAGRN